MRKSGNHRVCFIFLATFVVGLSSACTQQKATPDEIRQKTAEATAELKQNTKAVVEGVKEGLRNGQIVDLNKASKDDLLRLPGLTSEGADRVIAGRPYTDAHELVRRRIVSEAEYQQIKDKVTASR